jgi:hypothetical protein
MVFIRQRNRRLYCKTDRRIWSAAEVIKVIRMGIDVRVICSKTRNEITADWLASNLGKAKLRLDQLLTLLRDV